MGRVGSGMHLPGVRFLLRNRTDGCLVRQSADVINDQAQCFSAIYRKRRGIVFHAVEGFDFDRARDFVGFAGLTGGRLLGTGVLFRQMLIFRYRRFEVLRLHDEGRHD